MRTQIYRDIQKNILGTGVHANIEKMKFSFDELPDGLDDLNKLGEFERECMNEANNFLKKYNRNHGTDLFVHDVEFFVSGYSYCFVIETGRGFTFRN